MCVLCPLAYVGCDVTGKAWLKTFTWESLEPKLRDVQKSVLEPLGVEAVGAVGFCWGAYVTFKMSANKMIKACAACHPSLNIGPYLFDDPIEAQAAAVTTPVLLCPAGNDGDIVKEGGAVQDIITKKGLSIKIKTFPDMRHGWVPRGDATEAPIARDVQAALDQVTAFFAEQL